MSARKDRCAGCGGRRFGSGQCCDRPGRARRGRLFLGADAAGLTNSSLSGATLWQLVYTLKPNTTYRLSGAIRSQTAGTTTALEAKLYNGSAVTSASTTSSTYSKQSTTFTTGAGVTTARVYCHLVSGSGDGYCDEVTLTEQ